MKALCFMLLALACRATWGQPSETSEPIEPNVRHATFEDKASRIEELRVRGLTKRIVVTDKIGGTRYEIIVGDGSRDPSEGPSSARGAVGQRVWHVLSF